MATTEFFIISIVPNKGELKNNRPMTSINIMTAMHRTQKAEIIWMISAKRFIDKILILAPTFINRLYQVLITPQFSNKVR